MSEDPTDEILNHLIGDSAVLAVFMLQATLHLARQQDEPEQWASGTPSGSHRRPCARARQHWQVIRKIWPGRGVSRGVLLDEEDCRRAWLCGGRLSTQPFRRTLTFPDQVAV